MRVKVREVGNSLTVTIPKAVAAELHLAAGMEVDVNVRDDTVVVEPLQSPWDRLLQHARRQAREQGLDDRDIAEAIAASPGRRRVFADRRGGQS